MDISVSYIPSHQPIHLEADLKYMRQIGCNDVLFALQENHFQWLNGAVRFGPKIAREQGLKPRALVWGYANTSGGGRSSRVMLENPDMWQCDIDGKPYPGGGPHPMVCYNHPKAIQKYAQYIEQIWEAGFEEIMIDEPTPQRCFCQCCRDKFSRLYNRDLTAAENSKDYHVFQHLTVVDFVKNSAAAAKVISPKLRTSLCLMPIDRELFQDIAALTELDVFATDPYWLRPINKLSFDDAIAVSKYAKKLSDQNHKTFELYLGCFGIAGGQGLEEKIYSGSKILIEQSQPHRVTTWSFRGGIGLDHQVGEECDNPQLAWDSIVKLYHELSQNSKTLSHANL